VLSSARWPRPFFPQFALIGGAAALIGWALPYRAQFALAVGLLIFAIAAWLIVGVMRRPMAGVQALVLVAVLTPLESANWASTSLSIAVLLVCIWFLRQLVVQRQLVFVASGAITATLGLMAVTVLAFIVGQFKWFPVSSAPLRAQFGGMALFLASTGILLVVASVASRQDVKRLLWLFVWTGAVVMFATAIGRSEIRAGGLTISTSTSIGSVFYTWLVALAAGQGLWNRSLSRSSRAGLLALASLTVAHQLVVLFTWASAWIPPSIALGTILLMRSPRLTIAVSTLLVPLVLFDWSAAVAPIVANESYSWATRIAAALSMRDLIAHSPWVGFGPANYIFYTPFFPILGYRVLFNSHNNYIDVAAQTGVVGLSLFILILLALAWTAFRLARHFPAGFEKGYLMGALGGVIGTACSGMLGDWIIPFAYNVGVRGFRSSVMFWLFAGGVLAIDRIRREQTRPFERAVSRAPAGQIHTARIT